MKVTVNNSGEKEIDWDKPTLLTTKEGRKVFSTGEHSCEMFEGICLEWYGKTTYGKNWHKVLFTPFQGSITLEND